MSDDADLPPELRELEAALKARKTPAASAGLRSRVLEAARNEAAQSPKTSWRGFWKFAAGVAAALVLGCNLSMSAANDTNLRLGMRSDASDSQAALARLREILPEMSEDEARRQLLLLQARAQLVGTPQVRGGIELNRVVEEN